MSLKLSLVATSTSMRDGRSVRAQTTPESIETSPDCTPCVIRGRSLARLMNGRQIPPSVLKAVASALVARKRRREAAPIRIVMEVSASRLNAEACSCPLTNPRRLHDGSVTTWDNWHSGACGSAPGAESHAFRQGLLQHHHLC